MALNTVIDTTIHSNANHLCTTTPVAQPVYTIHTDVETAWHRRVCNIQLVPGFFTDRAKAAATLTTVRRTNPRAFIKTKLAYVA